MSSDGIRKATKGWEINSSGEMALPSKKVVAIDEPTVPAMAAMTDAAQAEIALAAAAKTEVSAPPTEAERPRRSTLDFFNEELAVLERPLEGDVEYIDEKPPRRWGHVAAFIATVAIVGGGGAFMLSQHRAAVAAQAPLVPAATIAMASPISPPAGTPETKPAPAEAPSPPAAAAAPVAAEDAQADDQPETDASPRKAASRTEWAKIRTKTASSKHVRSGGGKVVSRRTTTTTTRHHHVAKRTVSGRR